MLTASPFRFTGADRFLLLLDQELRRAGATGFQAAIGIELLGTLDRPRLARAFDAVRRAHVRLDARLVPAKGLRDWQLASDRASATREATSWRTAALNGDLAELVFA